MIKDLNCCPSTETQAESQMFSSQLRCSKVVEKKEYDPAIPRFKIPFGVEDKTGWFWAYFNSD